MKMKGAITIVLALIAIGHTQTVNISGVVKMSGGSGLEGVKVRLGKAAIMTTTAGDGSFTLKNNGGTRVMCPPHRAALMNDCSFKVEGNKLFFGAAQQAEVKAEVYDCNGRLLVSRDHSVLRGNYSITLPYLKSGIHIYRIAVNNEVYTLKSITGIAAHRGPVSSWKGIDLAKRVKVTSRINDALLFIKEGCQLYRIVVMNPDTSGLQITMVPLDTGTVTDADGNVYKTVRIGSQYWMAENLRTTKYSDGTAIGSDCKFYNNKTDAAAKKKWGALYTLNAIKSGKLAPTGWHIPSNEEYDTLKNYLIAHGYNYDGTTSGNKIAKSMAATTDWEADSEVVGAIGNDLSLNNASGFSALPTGWWYWGVNNFTGQGREGYWYTSTLGDPKVGYPYGWICELYSSNVDFFRYDGANVQCAVRLVRHI